MAWVLALIAVAVTASRWMDVAFSPLVLVQALSPLAAPTALVSLGGVLWAGRSAARTVLAALCLMVLAVHAAIWLPWFTDDTPGPGGRLTVMTASLIHGRADTVRISQVVRAAGVDVLVLTEVTAAAEANLRAAGIQRHCPMWCPARQAAPARSSAAACPSRR